MAVDEICARRAPEIKQRPRTHVGIDNNNVFNALSLCCQALWRFRNVMQMYKVFIIRKLMSGHLLCAKAALFALSVGIFFPNKFKQ